MSLVRSSRFTHSSVRPVERDVNRCTGLGYRPITGWDYTVGGPPRGGTGPHPGPNTAGLMGRAAPFSGPNTVVREAAPEVDADSGHARGTMLSVRPLVRD